MRRLDITKSYSRSRVPKSRTWCTVAALSFIVLMLLSSPVYTLGFGIETEEHQDITEAALPFLEDDILFRIVREVIDEDDCFLFHCPGWHAENHFDACDWGGSTNNINKKYERSLKRMDDTFKAADEFGELLHPAQDFYAHSNWVEINDLWSSVPGHGLPIVDNLVTPWEQFNYWNNIRSLNVYSVSEELPDDWKMSSPRTPEGLTPEIRTKDTNTLVGWAVFTHGRGSGDDCPDETEDWKHSMLNKDDDNPGGYRGDVSKYPDLYREAKSFAVKQTNHEFCRYLNLLTYIKPFGDQKASEVMGLWVKDADNLEFTESSPCHNQGESGDTTVTVSIKSIKIKNDNDDDENPGDLNLKFVLYTGDFRQATGQQTEQVVISSGTQWPEDKLPGPLTMRVDCTVPVITTVQGWDDEDARMSGKFNFQRGDLDGDEVLEGVSHDIPLIPLRLERHEEKSKTMDVLFEVSVVTGPGCPSNVDTDDDGIFDADDNCPNDANPGQEDSDGDGIGDACSVILLQPGNNTNPDDNVSTDTNNNPR